MNFLMFQIPSWAQAVFTWVLTGTNIVSLLGIIAAIYKIGATRKSNESINTTQVNLLTTMTAKLSDTRDLAVQVQGVSEKVGSALLSFEQGLTMQREANANLAVFIMECFNRSNLSDEAKAELQLMADKIFYNDNTKVIDALKTAKQEADAALAQGLTRIAELEAELAEQKQKLSIAQENVKESRRV